MYWTTPTLVEICIGLETRRQPSRRASSLKCLRAITESALEGLAKRELNLSAIVGKSVEAKERRLVPEAIEQFFLEAAPTSGIQPKEIASNSHTYRIGKVPRLALLARLLFFGTSPGRFASAPAMKVTRNGLPHSLK